MDSVFNRSLKFRWYIEMCGFHSAFPGLNSWKHFTLQSSPISFLFSKLWVRNRFRVRIEEGKGKLIQGLNRFLCEFFCGTQLIAYSLWILFFKKKKKSINRSKIRLNVQFIPKSPNLVMSRWRRRQNCLLNKHNSSRLSQTNSIWLQGRVIAI